jgi:hypothetical protein
MFAGTCSALMVCLSAAATPEPGAPRSLADVGPLPPLPALAPLAPAPLAPPEETHSSGNSVVPWLGLAGGSVALGAGTLFATQAAAAIAQLEQPLTVQLGVVTAARALSSNGSVMVPVPPSVQQAQSALLSNGLAATVLLSVGAAALVTSALLLLGR